MNRIDRYLIRHIFAMTGLVALILVSIYTFVVFVSDLGRVGRDGFGAVQLFEYAALLVPTNTYVLLPLIVLLGTLLGLGNLGQQNELTAIRAAGVSWLRVGGATLTAGVVLAVIGFALGNWLGPLGQQAAEALTHHGTVGGGQVHWLRNAGDVVRIDALRSADDIGGVTIYHVTPEHRIAGVVSAESARYVDGQWQLHNVVRSDFGADGVHVSRSAQDTWQGGVTPRVLKLFVLEKNSLSVPGLTRLIAYLHDNHLDAGKYEMLLWRKLVEPFSIMAMMLLAVSFAAARRLRESGIGQRLLAGIAIGVVFYVADKVAVSLGQVYDWSASLSAASPTLILVLLGGWRLYRLR